MFDENQLVVERLNRQHATQAIVLQQVMTAAVAAFGKKGREANKNLAEFIEELNGDG